MLTASLINEFKELDSGKEKREFLVDNVSGLGWKEASHFLRNVGYENLAILDRHIIKNLKNFKNIPKALTKSNYLETEKGFKEYSKSIKIPLDHLDLLFWSMETGEIFK